MQKILFSIGLLLAMNYASNAQVTEVKYLIEYNDSTAFFDCKIVIMKGEATSYPERIQFNSQYTIVTPAGANLTIEERHMPLEDNQFYTGTLPCLWEFGPKEFSPPTQPENDFHVVFPNLSPPNAYNDLNEGDTITLFSVSCDVNPCEYEIRPFENTTDPSSLEMPLGGDFSNGFSLGGGAQLYNGNLYSTTKNSITSSKSNVICQGTCTTLEQNVNCIDVPYSLEWSTGETEDAIEICPTETSNYYLLVKDTLNAILDSLPISITVHDTPTISLEGDSILCPYEITVISHDGGQLSSSDFHVATIDNLGNVTTISPGTTIITTTDWLTGCVSNPIEITVLEGPLEYVWDGIDLCLGETAIILDNDSLEGTWTSLHPNIASIDSLTGLITTISPGSGSFIYTDEDFECPSYLYVKVLDLPSVNFIGPESICVGESSSVIADGQGTWISNNPDIVSVDISGYITGLASGYTSLNFTDIFGCVSDPLNVTILSESDPQCIVNTEEIISQNLNVFPNPSNGLVTIKSDEFIESFALLSSGNQVLKEEVYNTGRNKVQFSTNSIPHGMYVLVIKGRNATYYKKLIVE